MVRKRLDRLARWVMMPSATPVVRDFVAVFLAGQGVIRLIDGRLFALTPLAMFSDTLYGHVQLITGVLLLVTRYRRWKPIGGVMAAVAAGMCAVLAAAAYQTSVTSSWGALVLMTLMINESFAGRKHEHC